MNLTSLPPDLSAYSGPPSPIAKTLVLTPEVVGNEADKGRIEQQVKVLTGRPDVEVVAVRKVLDSSGKIRSFEVDIR